MARESTIDVQKSDASGVPSVPEQTRPGAVYTPATDIFENHNSITVLADMPGAPERRGKDAVRHIGERGKVARGLDDRGHGFS